MKIRARPGQREESLDELLPEFDALGNRLEQSEPVGPPAEILVQRREVRDFVRQSIDRLPEGYRTVLILRDIEGYDTAETARLLDTTPGNVKTRLHRARAALKTLIEPLVSKGEP
jgi:RNA polymerase sigma-70 factor (ECF subfamily)